MYPKRPSATPILGTLVLLLVLLLTACGGGGDQSSGSGESQGGEQGEGEQQDGQQGGGAADSEQASQEKVSLGTIESVEPESRRVVLKPAFAAQGGDQITFRVTNNAVVQVNDQEAELSDIQQGQDAEIDYITKNDVNRAVAVEIVGDGG
jgi:hypothetical protein